MELFPSPLAIKIKKKKWFWTGKGPKNWEIFLGRKRGIIKNGKNTLKNHPRPYLYHQILMSRPKIININPKNDFKHQNKTLLKSNTKDIVLSGASKN